MIKFNLFEKIILLFSFLDDKSNFDNQVLLDDDFFNYILSLNPKSKNNMENNKKAKNNTLCFKENKNSNSNNLKIDSNKMNNERIVIEKYYLVKKLYKKLAIKFHPDKNGDVSIFIKVSEFYQKNLLIGLLLISFENNMFNEKLNKEDINKIFEEINTICNFILNKN